MAEMGSLKWELKHVFDLRLGGPRVHRIDVRHSTWSRSNAPCCATRPPIKENEVNSPTLKNLRENVGYIKYKSYSG